jgi:ribose transport system substrate-binding protein
MLSHKILARTSIVAALLLSGCILTGCQPSSQRPAAKNAGGSSAGKSKKSEYVFALIAKSQSNPVFQAARVGAEDAAKDLSEKLGVKITVDWRTPNEEDAQKQAEYVEQLAMQGVDGISISCSIADTVTPAINAAVKQGVPVMCFDSDAGNSLRFCFHGTDDVQAGRDVMRELVKVLGPGKHVVAIPGGSQNALNIQKRIRGAKEEAEKHPGITIKGVYYFKETPQDAAAKVEEVQTANPDIEGWAMVSAVCLFTDALMKWEPGKIKVVAMDALPVQLPYLRKGVAQKLLAQETYKWGYCSIQLLADKVILGKDPPQVLNYAPLVPVTKDNVDEFGQNWKKWLRRD